VYSNGAELHPAVASAKIKQSKHIKKYVRLFFLQKKTLLDKSNKKKEKATRKKEKGEIYITFVALIN
jgi:hypothetical protein